MITVFCLSILLYRSEIASAECLIPNGEESRCSESFCFRCKNSFWTEFTLPQVTLPQDCLAPPHCKMCIDNHYSVCERYCSVRCTSRACHNIRCESCPENYYRGFNGICYPCNKSACICSDDNQCIDCVPGRYGTYCMNKCPDDCQTCTKSTVCTECVAGKYGKACKLNCTAACKDRTCNKHSGICERCDNGYYQGEDGNCIRCSEYCKNNLCDQSNGSCIYGCIDGFTSERCSQNCPAGCLHCEQRNSSYCGSCKTGLHGSKCDESCNTHCQQMPGFQICQKYSGKCTYGCKDGYWGETCNISCETGCYDGQCNETTGICLYGCKEAFNGTRCEMYIPGTENAKIKTHTGLESLQEELNIHKAVVIGLSVAAGTAILVAITAIAILLRRRKTLDTKPDSGDSSRSFPATVPESNTNEYSPLDRLNNIDDAAYSTINHDYENNETRLTTL